jgi:hypothetical protein
MNIFFYFQNILPVTTFPIFTMHLRENKLPLTSAVLNSPVSEPATTQLLSNFIMEMTEPIKRICMVLFAYNFRFHLRKKILIVIGDFFL